MRFQEESRQVEKVRQEKLKEYNAEKERQNSVASAEAKVEDKVENNDIPDDDEGWLLLNFVKLAVLKYSYWDI